MKNEEKGVAITPKKKGEVAIKDGIDNLLASREYFIQQVLPILKENQDFYEIKGKKSLAKGGAEKLASIFKLTAKFEIDNEVKQALGDIAGLVAFKCFLNKGKEFIGQGGGADTLSRNQNDPNKTIKMAQKRAYVDAVIRATGLSDIFTQDIEDMEADKVSPSKTYAPQNKTEKTYNINPTAPASDKQKWLIQKLMTDLGLDMAWLERKAGALATMKMGVASQVIDQLNKKQENLLEPKKEEEIPTIQIDEETGEYREAEIEPTQTKLI